MEWRGRKKGREGGREENEGWGFIMMNKVRSLPELKSEALLVGAKKAIHDRGGYGAYVPSQLESPKSKLQVRTDWKAKYLK